MNYKKTYIPKEGYSPICEIGKCSLKMLEFGMIELHSGNECSYSSEEKEAVFIILGGRCTVKFKNGPTYENIGTRRSVFEGKATAVYIPRHQKVTVRTDWSVKIVVNATPVDEDTEPQLITPDMIKMKTLGQKPFERETTFIVDGSTNSKYLTIGEAYVTPGNWAGFPPHKHDTDAMPGEGILEEIYYFLFDPNQGFALQKMYTKDGSIDEVYTVKQDDLVEFPKGYHTTVGAPGYNTYFLWSMAGKHQGFFRSNDPDHEWVSAVENLLKKNK
ncbi:MAG: 5-deoxy-glucuronate isomerase [Sphaerochaetaceae bacterium]